MKRVISIMLALCLCLVCFVGCGNKYKGWEDQTLEDISFKVPPAWTAIENKDNRASYFITKHSESEKPNSSKDFRLDISVYEKTLDEVMKNYRNNKNYFNDEEKETKIAGQKGYYITGNLTGTESFNFEINIFYFKVSENKTCEIMASKTIPISEESTENNSNVKINKKELDLFLDSIQINK